MTQRNIPKVTARKPWTDDDIHAVHGLYIHFLIMQQTDTPYQKAPLVRELADELDRTKGSVEMKLMNISGCYDRQNREYVTGYKPMYNCQKRLIELVNETLGVQAA